MNTTQPSAIQSFFHFFGIRTEADVRSDTLRINSDYEQRVNAAYAGGIHPMAAGLVATRTVDPSTWTNATNLVGSIFPAILAIGSIVGGIIASVMTMNPAPAIFGVLFALYLFHSHYG
ncbi:MAG: hypothetical protein H7A38_04535 [Chlamydiales bacterium]|nr:hypothetical protein [Chlamydiales bacterium]